MGITLKWVRDDVVCMVYSEKWTSDEYMAMIVDLHGKIDQCDHGCYLIGDHTQSVYLPMQSLKLGIEYSRLSSPDNLRAVIVVSIHPLLKVLTNTFGQIYETPHIAVDTLQAAYEWIDQNRQDRKDAPL